MPVLEWARIALAVLLLVAEAAIAVSALVPKVSPEYRAYYLDRTSHSWHPLPSASAGR